MVDKNRELIQKMSEASNRIHKNTIRGRADYIFFEKSKYICHRCYIEASYYVSLLKYNETIDRKCYICEIVVKKAHCVQGDVDGFRKYIIRNRVINDLLDGIQ